jgi:hypothetical protein
MKSLFFITLFVFLMNLLFAQPTSLVASNYPRDTPSESDPTDYNAVEFRPCFRQDITGSPFTDYEGNTFPGLGEI